MIPFLDLAAQHRALRGDIQAAFARVLDSGRFILGDEVAAFEKEFASYVGAAHGVAVSSGTSALHLALIAAGVGPGDEVITAPFTFVATAAAIHYTGARPVFVDIDPGSHTIDTRAIEAAITPRTRAIVPVHLYGQPAEMDPILAMARQHGLRVIEDAAQAHGALYAGRRAGALGDMGCFSFYPTKNLGACGEGGIVVTGDDEHARTLRRLRDWGQERKGFHELKGFNARMQAVQAAILRVKLPHLDDWNDRRRAHAAAYSARLAGRDIRTPVEMPGTRHVFHAYTIRLPRRDAVRDALVREGIQTAIHYPLPVHLQPAYADDRYPEGTFPEAERAAREVLSLPLYPELSEADRETVCDALMNSMEAIDTSARS